MVIKGLSHNTISLMDNGVLPIRRSMRDLIFIKLEKQNPFPTDDASNSKAKCLDIAKRLEEQLYKMAVTKEEYLNQSTLESRLTSLLANGRLLQVQESLETVITATPGLGVSAAPTMDSEKRESEVGEP
ncbi:hypothetical protein CARUB_v10010638mg [Capsella rubella]|uniref:Uncharacterized protein n=1 Tax=Capsella rubella TaxID=81985 RepID=R0IHI9_9BRAS|nr:histone acetyltransferase HAC12 isoform X2 [Capsella rubella]EOA36328.1 hypothetical protein CARUB_v10010638mg [Capsella rubella]